MQDLIDQASMTEADIQYKELAIQDKENRLSQLYSEWLDWYNHPHTHRIIEGLKKDLEGIHQDISNLSCRPAAIEDLKLAAIKCRIIRTLISALNTSPLAINKQTS